MTTVRAREYRELGIGELETHAADLRKSLFNLRTRATTKELHNVSRIRQEKRELARVLTVIGEKKAKA